MSHLELEIVGEAPASLDLEPIQQVFSRLADQLEPAVTGTLNAAFVSDEQIQQLNRERAGNDYATDVLSFSYIEDGGEAIDGVLGEMVISLETARRQAAQAETSLEEEVALLVLHGSLHILGYDHQTTEQQIELQQLQRELMTAAGYTYREFQWKD